jgi:hypothetical protein
MLGPWEAQDIAWAAYLDALGEPFVRSLEIGITTSLYTDTREAPDWVPYEFYFADIRGCRPHRKFDPKIGGAWVDKRTGECRVWINEDFDPPPADEVPYGGTYARLLKAANPGST